MSSHRTIGDRIAELLVQDGLLTSDQLGGLQEIQRRTGERLAGTAVERGWVSEAEVLTALGRVVGALPVNLARVNVSPEVAGLVPVELSTAHKLLPISQLEGSLLVAMADPMNVLALDDVRRLTHLDVQPLIASEKSILDKIKFLQSCRTSLDDIVNSAQEELETEDGISSENGSDAAQEGPANYSLQGEDLGAEDAPVVMLANYILSDAIRNRASDIHLEPFEQQVRLRYRVDGCLIEWPPPPRNLHAALVTRLKVMSNLDIAEHRMPQDGRMRVSLEGKAFDLRVSVMPTFYGEKCVLRVLDPSSLVAGLNHMGIDNATLLRIKAALDAPHGLMLVTGPTGSGKTTTLYSALKLLNDPRYNIVTVEDPVEFQIQGINQIPVRRDLGLTFATALRSILRQDPDIIMIGEIRDSETAEIAIEAALTGHQVLSTMHCNDAAGAITRLDEMGIAPFLISSSVILSCAQRLIQVICPVCKETVTYGSDVLDRLQLPPHYLDGLVFHRGRGCEYCLNTGYHGRQAIVEALTINHEIRRLINQRVAAPEITQSGVAMGMKTLRMAAMDKVREKLTTLEQVLLITAEFE
ncbi:MAG TPA: ATPase, T2SS/T4P/T4SS family [Candidatus Paceibacterota bacterium]|nr:ATPase, T2SS/T4P/T4SS family [Verrucomicrobiota bacterium]HRY50444.1 ATPase, T2SS/T4P/T4SS family [Candidatus Paceibacterota bacterium]